jgi:hypothetical protein
MREREALFHHPRISFPNHDMPLGAIEQCNSSSVMSTIAPSGYAPPALLNRKCARSPLTTPEKVPVSITFFTFGVRI